MCTLLRTRRFFSLTDLAHLYKSHVLPILEFPTPAFCTGANCSIVAVSFWFSRFLALIQEIQREFRTTAFFTGADSCTVAGCVRPYLLSLHGLQKSKRMLPLPSFLTCSDGCAIADGVRCRPHGTFFQQLQGLLSALAVRTRADSCTIAGK